MKKNYKNILFLNSQIYFNILLFFNNLSNCWNSHKSKYLNENKFFSYLLYDFDLNLEKIIFNFNKNNNFIIALKDENKIFKIETDNMKLIYKNEDYDIYFNSSMKNMINTNNYDIDEDGKNTFHQKIIFIIDIVILKFQIFTNFFYVLENDESTVKNY